jgi:hypothetical protein
MPAWSFCSILFGGSNGISAANVWKRLPTLFVFSGTLLEPLSREQVRINIRRWLAAGPQTGEQQFANFPVMRLHFPGMLTTLLDCSAVHYVGMPIVVVITARELREHVAHKRKRTFRNGREARTSSAQFGLHHYPQELIGHVCIAEAEPIATAPVRKPLNFSQSRRSVSQAMLLCG